MIAKRVSQRQITFAVVTTNSLITHCYCRALTAAGSRASGPGTRGPRRSLRNYVRSCRGDFMVITYGSEFASQIFILMNTVFCTSGSMQNGTVERIQTAVSADP
ncbi:hypothetical protein EVAR_41695_1 [Eumeta japonica]|uniref:Uncharacterized protein n=1 Tax=Eumeta variegata TaxID=151549 RepID=A0A4C1VS25_EUMVA|nr:hypothetical protein EVAR_41695_1 [Eumeta japonica]